MCYPRFTKVIIDYFMTKDQSISRRNKMFWHTAKDDPMFNTIRDSEAYKQYYAISSGAEPPKSKTKYKKKADGPDTSSKPKSAPTVKKETQYFRKVALSEHEQMKIGTKRSKTQFHSSHASGSGDGVDTQSEVPDEQQQKDGGTDEGAGDKLKVPDVPKYTLESEEEFWTFSQGDDDDDDDEHELEDEKDAEDDDDKNDSEETESDDDGDDFVHPNLSTYNADDQEE
ncbi:hypothetical protein Tco_1051637 [Tanacetum coccineum]